MKTFTLTLVFLACTIFGFAQMDAGWQNKILKQKAKNELVLKQIAKLTNLRGTPTSSTYEPLAQLKSAAKQKLDSIVSWEYDQLSKIWKYDEKEIYEYDNQMRALRWLGNDWKDDTKTWITGDKTEFTYSAGGKLSTMITFSTDVITGQLERDNKTEYFYKPDGKLDSLRSYYDEPKNTWTLDMKQFFYYDASGRVIKWESWMIQDDEDEPDFGKWLKGGISKLEYDSSGKIIKTETYVIFNGTETLFLQTVYKYNASSQLESSETSGLYKDKYTYQYNAAGDVSVEISSTWDDNTQKWVEEDKYENIYGTLSSSDVIYPYDEVLFLTLGGDPFIRTPGKALASDKTFNKSGDNWVQTDKSTYYFSPGGSTKIDVLESPSLSFYPNPASESITLKWNRNYTNLNLQVFQINGAKVLEQKVVSDEKVSVSHLVKGMYLLKLLDGRENVYTGKLVKN